MLVPHAVSDDSETSPPAPQSHTMLLRKRQAAEELQVGERTLDRLVQAGAITPVRIGRSVRFSKEGLRGFIKAREWTELTGEDTTGRPGYTRHVDK